MKKILLITLGCFIYLQTIQAQTKTGILGTTISSLTQVDVSKGLKEALNKAVNTATTSLNKNDGYFGNALIRIPFPEEVNQVSKKLRAAGMGELIDKFELSMNRAAESAAKDAAPIFAKAITEMNITDAKSILTGNNFAATTYLKSKCNSSLLETFSPPIKKALDKNLATSYWTQITTYYNKIPLVSLVNTDLVAYTTTKALDGLYMTVGREEIKIRKDPAQWSTDILQKVFGAK